MTRRRGNYSLALFLLALGGLGGGLWWWSATREKPLLVDLDSPGLQDRAPAGEELRFAIAPVLSPERTVEEYHSLVNYLAARLHQPVRLVQRKTYHEVNELLRHGSVHVAIICTGAYLSARTERISLAVIAVPVHPGGPVYHSLIVVPAGSSAESFEDLQGRAFAFTDPLSLSGHYYPLSYLLGRGREPQEFFSRTTFTYSHDGSLRAVRDGIVDGAAVDSLVYDFEVQRIPALKEALRVVHRSPPLGTAPIVASEALAAPLGQRIRDVLLEMEADPAGQAILESLGIERIVSPPPGLYEGAEKIFEQVMRYLEARR